MSPPACTIIGGANGSGKSTVARFLRIDGEFVNADEIARAIDPARPDRASLAAGRRAIDRLAQLIERRLDFTYETTLSSHHSMALIRSARTAGFGVGLVFVALQDVELNIMRVADRVAMGGHAIPEATIRRRHDVILDNLAIAMALADAVLVYDNSDRIGAREILRIREGRVILDLLDPAIAVHRRIAAAFARSGEIRGKESAS